MFLNFLILVFSIPIVVLWLHSSPFRHALARLRVPKFPENIPAVPFWVTLLPFVTRVELDQTKIFDRHIKAPLRKHGAVKIFFGARWNILVHDPAYLRAILADDEQQWEKSGNHEKVPHSVVAAFLGMTDAEKRMPSRRRCWPAG